MPKVTFCTHDGKDKIGGPHSWIKCLLPALQDLGVQIQVLFLLDDSNPELCPSFQFLKSQGCECLAFNFATSTEERIKWLLRQINRFQPDVFIANYLIEGLFANRWLKIAGIPTVGVIHSDDLYYEAIFQEFLPTKSPYQLSGVVCVSKFLENKVNSFSISNLKTWQIPCGVNVPSRQTTFRSPFTLAYVGRLIEYQKNISKIAHAFSQVVTQIPGTEAIIIGDGPEKEAIEAIIASYDASHLVKLTGAVDSETVTAYLSNCQVITLLSEYEGIPIALMEGMSLGLVPVCLKIRSGLPELIQHEQTGIFIEDETGYLDAIKSLKDNPERFNQMSQLARQKIVAEFSNEICAQRWLTCLETLAQERRPRQKVPVPWRITLPPPHPALHWGDRRALPIHLQIRRRLGKLKCRLLDR